MERDELGREAGAVFHALRGRVREADRDGMISLFGHGEEEEAIDLLVAVLVEQPVPLSPGEAEAVRRLVRHFDVPVELVDTYRYLADPSVLARLDVG